MTTPRTRFRLAAAAFVGAAALLAASTPAPAATLYWVGDASAAFYDEPNWSTVPNNAAAAPAGDPVNTASITDDLVIAGLYNGSPIANPPGGGPIDDNSSGIGSNVNLSGNTVTLSGTTMRIRDNNIVNGDTGNLPTLNLDNGAILSAEAMRGSNFNLADTSQLIFWGIGTAVFTDSTFNFQSASSSLRLLNVAFGTDISAQLANAAGFQFMGSAITAGDLLITNDGEGGTLIRAIPTPAALPMGLLTLGALAMRRRGGSH